MDMVTNDTESHRKNYFLFSFFNSFDYLKEKGLFCASLSLTVLLPLASSLLITLRAGLRFWAFSGSQNNIICFHGYLAFMACDTTFLFMRIIQNFI